MAAMHCCTVYGCMDVFLGRLTGHHSNSGKPQKANQSIVNASAAPANAEVCTHMQFAQVQGIALSTPTRKLTPDLLGCN